METIDNQIKQAERYWAHVPHNESIGHQETLKEHSDLVFSYTQKMIKAFGLEAIIKKLLSSSFSLNWSEATFYQLYDLFLESVYFHDFGKINPNFQVAKMKNGQFSKKALKYNSDHSFPGYVLFIQYKLKDANAIQDADEFEHYMVLLFLFGFQIAKHHASFLDNVPSYLQYKFDFSDREISQYLDDVDKLLELTTIEEIPTLKLRELSDISSIVKDILRDNSKEDFPLFALLKLHYSLLTASDYLATAHYMNNWETPLIDFGQISDELRQRIIRNVQSTKSYNRRVFENLNGFEFSYPIEPRNENLNRLRQELSVEVVQNIRNYTDKNVFYIEAPTGGGKTNLSILAAAELLAANTMIRNLYYVFPFTTLITQTYKAVKETMGLDEDEIIQLHSKVGFKEKDDQYGQEKKNHIDYLFLNFPVALMSHVKFFDILKTNSKEANYLLHRLANSIVIVDELQSYPPKIWDKLIYFIQNYARYFNIRFILMSATLPKLDKLSNVKADICYLTNHRKQFFQNPNFCNRVLFDFSLLNWPAPEKDEKADYLQRLADAVIEKSVEYADRNKKYPDSVFTIIEFIYKQTATEFYSVVKDKSDGFFDDIFVLSGTILEPRRKEIIYYLKDEGNRHKKILLITTQVVEAGVDIDMDLGFKDKSLLDSDEQLAGRINRNVNKPACKLYLFNFDDAEVLYKGDKRFQLMQGELAAKEQEILQSKDFDLMYDWVMKNIDRQNDRIYQKGFSDFQNFLKMLDFPEVDKNFQIINQKSTSVYVPVTLPVYVPETNQTERNFSEKEMMFLDRYHIAGKDDLTVSGEKVFELYERLIQQKNDDFVDGKTELKKLQGIMSQFIFSLMTRSKAMEELVIGAHGEERMGIYYLSHWERDEVYDYEFGLIEKGEAAIIL
ncbi:MAG: CRISPR-associated helicase Cas3' [Bacteroidales bacterium]|nr:CRISPR-associated helicase Cas3' [Bacteroidales bacterium]